MNTSFVLFIYRLFYPTSLAVLFIENVLERLAEMAEIIDASGYEANRFEASSLSAILSHIRECSPNVIMCYIAQANQAMEVIVHSNQPTVVILIGNAADRPIFEAYSAVKIGYIMAPFIPTGLQAINDFN